MKFLVKMLNEGKPKNVQSKGGRGEGSQLSIITAERMIVKKDASICYANELKNERSQGPPYLILELWKDQKLGPPVPFLWRLLNLTEDI